MVSYSTENDALKISSPILGIFLDLQQRFSLLMIRLKCLQNFEKNDSVVSIDSAFSDVDFGPTVHKRHEKMQSATIESLYSTAYSELLTSIYEGKIVFAEALNSLNLLEDYIQYPSEKTSERLTLHFDRVKGTNCENFMKNCLRFVNADGENKDSQNSDYNRADPDKNECEYDLDDYNSQINSISSPNSMEYFQTCPEQSNDALERQLQMALLESANHGRAVEELKKVNNSLKVELENLQLKHRETLAELGQLMFEKTVKEKKEKKVRLSKLLFGCPTPKVKPSDRSTCNTKPNEDDQLSYSNGFPIHCPNVTLNRSSNDFSASSSNIFSSSASSSNSSSSNPSSSNASSSDKSSSNHSILNDSSSNYSSKSHKSNIRNENCDQGAKSLPENRYSNDKSTSMNETTSNSLENETLIGREGVNQSNDREGINQPGKREEVKEASNMGSTPDNESSIAQNSTGGSVENLSFPVEQDHSNGREYVSLRDVPSTSVATTLYKNYKFLLLTLAQRLLSDDVLKLMNWASQNFSIDNSQNATDILFKLDEKEVINASDLSQLRDFFESIIRVDLVHIIDAFLLGDYTFLWQTPTSRKRETDANKAGISQRRTTSRHPDIPTIRRSSQGPSNPLKRQTFEGAGKTSPQAATVPAKADRNLAPVRKPENNNEPQSPAPQLAHEGTFPNFSAYQNITNSTLLVRSSNEAQTAGRNGQLKFNPGPAGLTASPISTAVTDDGPVSSERQTTSSNNSSIRSNPASRNQGRNTQPIGSNGLKHSKHGRPETEPCNVSNPQFPGSSRNQATNDDQDGNWLCSHYKRRCYVKFECCDKFWPCHRCHNNQSSCDRKRLKSRDTVMLKCAKCKKVQKFGERCISCNTEFARYFCRLCKHLTGTDDHPYHCQKCGICRSHGNRSFHCDICDECLDVQLRGNHKCSL